MKPLTWNRPLLWLAAGMALLAVISIVGSLIDHREVGGVNLWIKPLKFALSIGVYAVSLAWLLELLGRPRFARVVSIVSVVGLMAEVVIIVGAAAFGLASHFNVSTPLHTALWAVMAFSIVVVWMVALVVAVVLFRVDLGDPARSLAIRAGLIIAVVGMGLAFLMTSPTAQQLSSFEGIAGAHAVGVADGGPGLPLLGWSTVAGDLRIPHFVGMHALQVLPLLIVAIELLARRFTRLRDSRVRLRLVLIAVVTYVGTLAVLTWQALSAQSIVHPAGAVLVVGLALAAAAIVATLVVVTRRNGVEPSLST